MTKYIYQLFALFFLIVACNDKAKLKKSYYKQVPVYRKLDDIRNSFKITEAKENLHPGKITWKDNYIFIVEKGEGIHVTDISDAKNPIKLAFIQLLGIEDLSVKGNIIYANSANDIVSIEINNISNSKVLQRQNDVINMYHQNPNNNSEMLIKYEEQYVEEYVDYESNNNGGTFSRFRKEDLASSENNNNSTSKSGSMARFSIVGSYLYAVNNTDIIPVNISEPKNLIIKPNVFIGNSIETIFPYQGNLLIGSSNGMFIYDISNPAIPTILSQFIHFRACDPVVAENNFAYVTLRSGSTCGGFSNQLDVLDISNPMKPTLIKSYPVDEPYGLGIDGNLLFICHGSYGLKVYDVSNKSNITNHILYKVNDLNYWDVIPNQNKLLATGKDGVKLYSYDNEGKLSFLSNIN